MWFLQNDSKRYICTDIKWDGNRFVPSGKVKEIKLRNWDIFGNGAVKFQDLRKFLRLSECHQLYLRDRSAEVIKSQDSSCCSSNSMFLEDIDGECDSCGSAIDAEGNSELGCSYSKGYGCCGYHPCDQSC